MRKFLRLAAVGSGGTDAERANAAQRAGELIAEHGFTVLEKFDPALLRARTAKPAPVDAVAEDYARGYTDHHGVHYTFHKNGTQPRHYPSTAAAKDFCRKCGKTVWAGERVMIRMTYGVVEYIHDGCWQAEAR